MVIDLVKWRKDRYTEKLENWMRIQKRYRIYELGSLPPFLLVFAGNVEGVEHRWNQHGLGGDNLQGLCRDLHPGSVSLLHWSGKGKPWLRLDSKKPCPLDGDRDRQPGIWICVKTRQTVKGESVKWSFSWVSGGVWWYCGVFDISRLIKMVVLKDDDDNGDI
ncbi:hypothetical protein AgCh_018012 [Apium graveolens]